MKDYYQYNLEDFLGDEDFQSWVNGSGSADVWNNLANQHPEKKVLIREAAQILLSLQRKNTVISDQELESEVNRILEASKRSRIPIKPLNSLRWKWFSAAASVVFILGLGYTVNHFNQPEPVRTYQQYISKLDYKPHEIINHTGKSMLIKLPDGSRIRLTPDSRISYADDFIKDKKREVYLSGEAFFQVQKDRTNPFYVYANGLLTRVVGTSFLIKARSSNVEVIVTTGKVSVTAIKNADHQKSRELLLTPNQQASFTTDDQNLFKSIVTLPVEIPQQTFDPDFNFENQPLTEVFSVLQKAYGIPIIFNKELLQNCSLRVALGSEPFFSKLDIICETIGASYEKKDGQIIIYSKGCP